MGTSHREGEGGAHTGGGAPKTSHSEGRGGAPKQEGGKGTKTLSWGRGPDRDKDIVMDQGPDKEHCVEQRPSQEQVIQDKDIVWSRGPAENM